MGELRIPGPTPCPPEVLQAMTKQMINHRGKEFINMLNQISQIMIYSFRRKTACISFPTVMWISLGG